MAATMMGPRTAFSVERTESAGLAKSSSLLSSLANGGKPAIGLDARRWQCAPSRPSHQSYPERATTGNVLEAKCKWRVRRRDPARHDHRQRLRPRASATQGADRPDDSSITDGLAREFARLINEKQTARTSEVRPSALLPPTAVVEALMNSLMRNDWPEEDSGMRTAFAFAMPFRVEEMLPGQVRPPVTAARSWEAMERWLRVEEFSAVIRQPPYVAIVGCSHWEVVSPLQFHGPGDKRAVQAVKVTSSAGESVVNDLTTEERTYTYTFCLEKVETGAYKGCWMVVGLRVGDYANV